MKNASIRQIYYNYQLNSETKSESEDRHCETFTYRASALHQNLNIYVPGHRMIKVY